jgi:hypothetical protein
MLADGGDCLADLGVLGDQQALFGPVASSSTAFRVIDRIASTPGLVEALRAAHARARARVEAGRRARAADDRSRRHDDHQPLRQGGRRRHLQGRLRLSPDAGLHTDETGEALAGQLRPGNANANTGADQIAVAEAALEQIPAAHIESLEPVLRADSAGATHELLD